MNAIFGKICEEILILLLRNLRGKRWVTRGFQALVFSLSLYELKAIQSSGTNMTRKQKKVEISLPKFRVVHELPMSEIERKGVEVKQLHAL